MVARQSVRSLRASVMHRLQRSRAANWAPAYEAEAMHLVLGTDNAAEFERSGQNEAEAIRPLIEPGDTVMDVGCGIGRVTRYIAPHARTVWAVDGSAAMLKRARQRMANLTNVRYARTKGTRIPVLGDRSVDVAFSILTLQHLTREDAFLLLREVHRVLKPGSMALFTFPNLLADEYLDLFVRGAEDHNRTAVRTRCYTPEEVGRIVPAAGYTINECNVSTEIRVTCTRA